MKLSVIIPVFNEVQTILAIVERVQAVPLDQEIVIVNDASSDGTSEVVEQLASARVKVIHHQINMGKGAALPVIPRIKVGSDLRTTHKY